MWRQLLRFFAPVLLAAGLWLPAAHGQVASPSAASGAKASEEEEAPRTPAFPYMVAALFTLFILVIVCMPSRKA